jgi:hypothetical protein
MSESEQAEYIRRRVARQKKGGGGGSGGGGKGGGGKSGPMKVNRVKAKGRESGKAMMQSI